MVIYEKQEKKNREIVRQVVKSYKEDSKPIVKGLIKKQKENKW